MNGTQTEKEHIATISRKLQRDVNTILTDLLSYIPDAETNWDMHVEIDVDHVLKQHLPTRNNRILLNTKPHTTAHVHTKTHNAQAHILPRSSVVVTNDHVYRNKMHIPKKGFSFFKKKAPEHQYFFRVV